MSNFLKKIHSPIDSSWDEFLSEPMRKKLSDIEKSIQIDDFTPNTSRVLHFLTVPINNIKVLILGQDPYPQSGIATGRAFEVGTLKNWGQPFRQVSLKNIVRLIYKTYYNKIEPFKTVCEWNHKTNAIMQPNQLFQNWEKQGVLLLNTALTCKSGESASHSKLWYNFTKELLCFIDSRHSEIRWILWGGHAQKIIENINIRHKLFSNHPMMCSPKNENDFLFGKTNTLDSTKDLIDWRGV